MKEVKENDDFNYDKLNTLTHAELIRSENGKATIGKNSSNKARSKGGQTNKKTGHISKLGKKYGSVIGKKYGHKNGVKVAATGLGTKAAIEITSKKICQYTMDNKLVKIWNSLQEAGRNGFSPSAISKCCNNLPKFNSHKGFIWKFKN